MDKIRKRIGKMLTTKRQQYHIDLRGMVEMKFKKLNNIFVLSAFGHVS